MQASDDALDAIHCYKELKRKHQDPRSVFGDPADHECSHTGIYDGKPTDKEILGLADWLLDRGIKTDRVAAKIAAALTRELTPERLECWRDPAARQAALLRFQDRLEDRPVDPEQLAQDNEGLLSRMSRFLTGNDK